MPLWQKHENTELLMIFKEIKLHFLSILPVLAKSLLEFKNIIIGCEWERTFVISKVLNDHILRNICNSHFALYHPENCPCS